MMSTAFERSIRRYLGVATAAAATVLAACGDAGGGVTTPTPEPEASCQPLATVALGVGETMPLTADQAACFRVAPHGGAQYVLAAFDARSLDGARTGPEPSPSTAPVYWLGDAASVAASGPPPSSSRAPADAAASHVVVRREASAAGEAGDPFQRATPWAEGERFPVKRPGSGEIATARVVKVYGGRFVFAVIDADAGSHASRLLADAGKAMEFMLRTGVGVLDRAFGERRPTTSDGAGQLLFVFTAWDPANGAASTVTRALPGSVHSFVWMNLRMRPGEVAGMELFDFPTYRLKVLSHEMTHAWQARWAHETQGEGARTVAFGPAWATEGTADLLAVDLVRRWLDVGLTANWGWRARLRTEGPQATYALEPADTRGRLARGYFDASSFLRDLQVRMVRRGVAPDEALAQVAQGAMEGWWGIDGAGVRRRGLADRARAVFGAGWEPANAVLLWTLTQAVDDQTNVAELNNPVYESAADPDFEYAWKPAADDLRAGSAGMRQVQGAPGSSLFVRVKDGGSGGVLSARAGTPGARWMIVRSR